MYQPTDEELRKVDLVRERTGLSYRECREVLTKSQWNVVDALVLAEQYREEWENSWTVRGRQVLDKVRELVRQGNVTRIRIKHKDEILVEFPVTAAVAGALVLPKAAIIAAGVCLFTQCTIEVDREDDRPVTDGLNSTLYPQGDEI
ncbi:MAG: DUF4342 domain-containing protein [Firmicutes bacterium]|nr:DUF4342 domain-containing protein [Bacillota bacterium]